MGVFGVGDLYVLCHVSKLTTEAEKGKRREEVERWKRMKMK